MHDPLDEIEDLLDAGRAVTLATLAEDAHGRAETALGHIDDSGGWLTDIADLVARLRSPAPRSILVRWPGGY